MPGRDGTGPDGTYENCMPKDKDRPLYRRRGLGRGTGRGLRYRQPGMGGRGRGYMNRFDETGQPGQRGAYQPQRNFGLLEKLVGKLEKIIEKLNKE